jgi:N-acetylmuramoyl-L-alanine amidase
MPDDIIIEDEEDLIEIRNELLAATDQLLEDRLAAIQADDQAKVTAAEAHFDRIGRILAAVQGAINRNEAANMNVLAARVNESIAAQQAAGLSKAIPTLRDLITRFAHPAETTADSGGPAPGSTGSVPGNAGPGPATGGPAPGTGGSGPSLPAGLLGQLVAAYRSANVRHPQLRAVTLAQWMLESGRAESQLAQQHLNFGGLKWRPEMAAFATKVSFAAHDGVDDYCKFESVEKFIGGYWRFLDRSPYAGWQGHAGSAEAFMRFIGPIYTPTAGYADKVLALVSEATALLSGVSTPSTGSSASGGTTSPGSATSSAGSATSSGTFNLGTIVIDPGHGGATNVAGSSANNAISASGVKEKTLTLQFAQILQSELLSQAGKAGERLKVVLTRTTDVNVTGARRAGTAFDHEARLFLSIHFNGSSNPGVRGVETFYRAAANGNLNLEEDKAFARDVQQAVFAAIAALDGAVANRGIKPDTDTRIGALGVLNDVRLGNDKRDEMCRAALVEIEFISNPAADRLLVSGPDAGTNRTKVMAALAERLRTHMRQMGAAAGSGVGPVAGGVGAAAGGAVGTGATPGSLAARLEQQIAAGRIIFDKAGLRDELLGRNAGLKVTTKLQTLVLRLCELTPVIRISSLVRPGTSSHHGSGCAVDIGNEEIAAALLPALATDARIAELGIDELIFDAGRLGHADRNKWNYDRGSKHKFDIGTLIDHGDHIHLAVKD